MTLRSISGVFLLQKCVNTKIRFSIEVLKLDVEFLTLKTFIFFGQNSEENRKYLAKNGEKNGSKIKLFF